MKNITFAEITGILNSLDDRDSLGTILKLPKSDDLREKFGELLNDEAFNTKCVIGIDIYHYSRFPKFEQSLIPIAFDLIYEAAATYCMQGDGYYFQYLTLDKFKQQFISTGDGGFQIFDDPIKAVLFIVNLSTVLRTFNSFHMYPKLRDIIGELNFRFVITYDSIYRYNDNYFGSGIISNARILSKDRLNRLLIDENTYRWFLERLRGIENLLFIGVDEISILPEYIRYDRSNIEERTFLLPKNPSFPNPIHDIHVMHIGDIQSKNSLLNVYNLYFQVFMALTDELDTTKSKNFNVSVGNLNTAGIGD